MIIPRKMNIDVNNIDNIGLDGLYVCHGDTLAVMNNSIEVDDTKLINKYTPNATISIVCRKATVDDAYMFRHDQNIACTGDHIPSGMPMRLSMFSTCAFNS